MNYTSDMNLISESGYSMPFTGKNEEVVLIKTFGHQEDGSFNHGIDLATDRYVLLAVADGVVSGIGSNKGYGMYQVAKYDKYEVTYGNISNALIGFGKKVKAGDRIAISGKSLHIEVKYDGNEVNPMEFLTMLFGNVKVNEANPKGGVPDFETLDMDIPTDYDDHQDEIEELMMRFYPEYIREVAHGLYSVPTRTEESLRNIFSLSSVKNYFYDKIPSMANPLGLSERSVPIAAKVQNLLIGDFLNYLAIRHQIYLSVLDEAAKKKDMTKQPNHAD